VSSIDSNNAVTGMPTVFLREPSHLDDEVENGAKRDAMPTGLMGSHGPPAFIHLKEDTLAMMASPWESWIPFGEKALGRVAACNQADGRLEIVVRDCVGAIHRRSENDDGTWSPWSTPRIEHTHTNGSFAGDISVARYALDGRLAYFAHGIDQAVWSRWQNVANATKDGVWQWISLGGVCHGAVTAVERNFGGIELFIVGADNALWHKWSTDSGWSHWDCLGGVLTGNIAIESNLEGYPEVFVRGPDNACWRRRHLIKGGWKEWESMGGCMNGDPVAAKGSDGRLEVFSIGMDNELYHMSQNGLEEPWSPWRSVKGSFYDVVAATRNPAGQLEVFAKGMNGALWHILRADHEWTSWEPLGGYINHVTVCKRKDGLLSLFATGPEQDIYVRSQRAPGIWT
jgi:hypothetical protein